MDGPSQETDMQEFLNEYLPLPEDIDDDPSLTFYRTTQQKERLVEGFKMMFPDWEDDDDDFLY